MNARECPPFLDYCTINKTNSSQQFTSHTRNRAAVFFFLSFLGIVFGSSFLYRFVLSDYEKRQRNEKYSCEILVIRRPSLLLCGAKLSNFASFFVCVFDSDVTHQVNCLNKLQHFR